jgi:hypothetical protein
MRICHVGQTYGRKERRDETNSCSSLLFCEDVYQEYDKRKWEEVEENEYERWNKAGKMMKKNM